MPANWEDDSAQLRANLAEVAQLLNVAAQRRTPPSLSMSKQWHRLMLQNLAVPDPALIGTFRGEPGLEDAEVHIAGVYGAPATTVQSQLRLFETELARQVATLDNLIPDADLPSPPQLTLLFNLCAWAHAEWIRIHPFGNGNGASRGSG